MLDSRETAARADHLRNTRLTSAAYNADWIVTAAHQVRACFHKAVPRDRDRWRSITLISPRAGRSHTYHVRYQWDKGCDVRRPFYVWRGAKYKALSPAGQACGSSWPSARSRAELCYRPPCCTSHRKSPEDPWASQTWENMRLSLCLDEVPPLGSALQVPRVTSWPPRAKL
jgi:hypothetical protein